METDCIAADTLAAIATPHRTSLEKEHTLEANLVAAPLIHTVEGIVQEMNQTVTGTLDHRVGFDTHYFFSVMTD